MDSIIQLRVENVTTVIGTKKLIEDISFSIKKGQVLALVGHNGAGKSTLMKTILRMMEKQSGEITICDTYSQDNELLAFKENISYLPEEPMLLTELTVMQHFQLYGKSYGLTEDELQTDLEKYLVGFELTEKVGEYPESLSKGMRQKVQTICALLPNVPVLLIDEPFIGLDIYSMQYLIDIMQEKVRNGTSILLTTHQLDLVKDLADTFILLQDGKLVDQGDINQFETIIRGSIND